MWGTMSKTNSLHGLLLLLLSWAAVTSSLFGPPCMSQLGLRHDHSNPSLVFDTFVSNGDSAYIRLNGPKAWRVSEIKDSYIEINVSQPVLLTGLQVQGDPNLAGRVTAWTLETSLDCTDYRAEDYSVEYEHPLQVLTVHLKAIEFVSCLRLKPTRFEGKVAALRLELLGCVVSDSTSCPRDVHPIAEIWMEGGGRQLNFEHEVMLSWAKVLLDVKAYGDTGDIGLFYSRSCDHWTYIEPLDTNTMSITSSDSTSRWVTIEFDTPIRASCVRIFPPLATSLKEIHVDACSTSTLSRLQEMNIDTLTDIHEKSVNDAPSYETETPGFPQRMDLADVKAHIEKESKTKTVLEKSDVNTTEESPNEDDSIETTATTNQTNNFTQPVTTKETPITTTLFSILSAQENYEDFAHGSESNDTIDISKSILVSENKSVVGNEISQASSHEEIQNASVGWVSIETVQQEANASAADNPSENSINETSILFEEGPPGDTETHSHDVPEDGSVNTTVDLIMDNSTLSAAESENTTSSTDSGDHNVSEDATTDKNFDNILPAVCGKKKAEEGIRKKRVISGQMNTPGQWPWLVSMHFLPELPFTKMSGFKHLCGANLIAPDWIVTAAHCFSDDLFKGLGNASNWRIYFGMYDLAGEDDYQSFKQKRTIKTIINYPDYNIILKPLINDISLVRLNEPVEMTEFVSPICLDESDRYFKEEVCYVTGWGKTTTESPGSRFPYTAPVKIETLETCNKTYEALPEDNEIKMYVDIKPPVLCGGVGNGGEDACQGDSGGPLMCEHDGLWHLAAIVSAGLECGNQELPGLYTRVSQFDKWIKEAIETYESK